MRCARAINGKRLIHCPGKIPERPKSRAPPTYEVMFRAYGYHLSETTILSCKQRQRGSAAEPQPKNRLQIPNSQTRKSQTPINNIGMPRYTGQNVQRSTNPKLQILNSAARRGFILRPWSLRTLTARKAEAYENCRLKFSLKSTLLPHSTAKRSKRGAERFPGSVWLRISSSDQLSARF